jgi:hypothetical protein
MKKGLTTTGQAFFVLYTTVSNLYYVYKQPLRLPAQGDNMNLYLCLLHRLDQSGLELFSRRVFP